MTAASVPPPGTTGTTGTTPPTARFVIRCVHGIERVAAAEAVDATGGSVEHTGHREVHLSAPATPAVLGLRTADDVFLLGAEFDGIGHTRAELATLADHAAEIDVDALLGLRDACGGADDPPYAVDVSASFVGKRNFNRYDIEDAVGQVLADRHGVAYHSRREGAPPPDGSVSWRVTLSGSQAMIALRITDRPLHRRPYKQASISGTLHPPLAAAMVRLSELGPGGRFLDPCCGVGTVPIEAYDACPDARVAGSDLDEESVNGARANAAGRPIAWTVADAGRLPEVDAAVDRIATNPPWGRQVPPSGRLAGEPLRFWTELRRVLRPGGRAVVLLHEPEAHLDDALAAGLMTAGELAVSLFGTHPRLVILG